MTTYKACASSWGRRRLLGTATASGMTAAFMAACSGGGSTEQSSTRAAAENQTGAGAQTSTRPGETPKAGGVAATRMAANPPLDPITNTTFTAQTAASFCYSRLLKNKSDGDPKTADNRQPAPDLASGYEAADGLQYTFKLKPATFHNKPPINGRAVEAEDVKVTLERFRTDLKNTNRAVFGTQQNPLLDRVETPDAQTVVFKLAKPFGPFLSLVATAQYLWIMPKEAATGGVDPNREQIGSGPFVFESLQPDIEVKYKRNPAYFDKGLPYVEEMRLVVLTDSTQETVQFQAQRLDVAAIAYDEVASVKKSNADAQVVTYLSGVLPFLSPQQRGTSPFRDERVRRALSMAVDRDAMLELSWGGQGVWQNMVPASFGRWHVDPKGAEAGPGGKNFKYDVKEAVALLKAAGYDESKKLDFKYIFTSNGYNVRYNQWAESVAGMLKETKILNPAIASADYLSEYIKTGGIFFGAYEGVAFMLQSGFNDPHDFLYNPLSSQSQRNHAGINDPHLDAMLDKEQGTIDINERVKLVHEIEQYVMEKMYYAPMFIGPDSTFLQPWVRNYYVNRGFGVGAESFLDMWLAK